MMIIKDKIIKTINEHKKYNIITEDNLVTNYEETYKIKYKIFFKTNIIYLFLLLILFNPSSFSINKLLFHLNKPEKYLIPNAYRLAFVFGTRPEAIKLFPLIREMKKIKNFICIIINTGQHKEMINQIFDSLNMDNDIDFNLNIMRKNQSLSKLTSNIISELEAVFNLINPNAVIVQGDTTTGFSAAITAFYKKIPIFHVEAGLRTHNFYFPFPEEFNRKTIDDLSTLHFAPTEWALNNLIKENINPNNIYLTGNTIVDSLQLTLNKTSPTNKIKMLIKKAKNLCLSKNDCKIILLTCHRRENYFKPIYNIMNAIQDLLKNFNDIVVIFPFHLNPNIQKSIKDVIPNEIYSDLIRGKQIKITKYQHLNRFIIIPPLDYFDLVHLESQSYFIMTDSGGIQEEAVSIGKPILILRDNTERLEAVKLGCAFLTGISYNTIYHYASSLITNHDLYNNIYKCQYLYGKGNSSIIISQIIEKYFTNNITINRPNYKEILLNFDNSLLNVNNSNFNKDQNMIYDIVIVLTVWKRNNLEKQLLQVKNQSILKNKKTNLIIFQNSNHTNIENIVNKWKNSNIFSEKVDITYIQSPIETGYFGRFIIPLTSSVVGNSYFFICDDDIIWGNRYFENMIRVVNEGSLATRNGRIIDKNFNEIIVPYKNGVNKKHICYDEDIEYDFGGQIWAGRISWLRKAWNHIPFSLENSEDFWISAVLKSFYNISTKTPKCPCPDKISLIPDMCAASDKSAIMHQNATIGKSNISHNIRPKLIKNIIRKYNYKQLIYSKYECVDNIYKKFVFGYNLFNLNDSTWKDALYWQ